MIKHKILSYDNGNVEWFNGNDELHCDFGPAFTQRDGYKSYWINGIRHREDGPAIVTPSGYNAWFLNGVEYTEEEFLDTMYPRHIIIVNGKKYKLVEK